MPASYTDNGKEYCWLHREPLDGAYPVFAHFLFAVYDWRGHSSKFPNAKLYEAYQGQETNGTATFCCKCQEEYESWFRGHLTYLLDN